MPTHAAVRLPGAADSITAGKSFTITHYFRVEQPAPSAKGEPDPLTGRTINGRFKIVSVIALGAAVVVVGDRQRQVADQLGDGHRGHQGQRPVAS